jgi:hypothetical protein
MPFPGEIQEVETTGKEELTKSFAGFVPLDALPTRLPVQILSQ